MSSGVGCFHGQPGPGSIFRPWIKSRGEVMQIKRETAMAAAKLLGFDPEQVVTLTIGGDGVTALLFDVDDEGARTLSHRARRDGDGGAQLVQVRVAYDVEAAK